MDMFSIIAFIVGPEVAVFLLLCLHIHKNRKALSRLDWVDWGLMAAISIIWPVGFVLLCGTYRYWAPKWAIKAIETAKYLIFKDKLDD